MKFRPPRHRVDAPIVFVHPADDAWNKEKVAKWEEEHGDDSPFARYHSGATRFDLSAKTEHGSPNEAVGKGAVEFHLRRLSALELNEVQGLMEREVSQDFPIPRSAWLQACRYGLVAIKTDGRDLVDLDRRTGALRDADIEAIADMSELGFSLVLHIGQASYAASQPLRDDEKKH